MKKKYLVTALLLLATTANASNEISLSVGSSTRNINNQKATSVQVEYKYYFTDYLALSGAYLNEGYNENSKRDGAVVAGWLSTNSKKMFVLFGGVGGYFNCNTSNNEDIKRKISPIVTAGLQYNITDKWLLKGSVSRVIASDNQDSDVFNFGVGFKF